MKDLKVIKIKSSKPYSVYVKDGLIKEFALLISKHLTGNNVLIVTDDVVEKLYLKQVVLSLESANKTVFSLVLKNGEQSKNFDNYKRVIDFLCEKEFTRKDSIVALGGGVVGDLTGFVASTYLRGINYVQVPTTLLSAVDSSVGGKTAIDVEKGKNLVGAFYSPKAVIIDSEIIKNLPKEVHEQGFGEVIKYAVLDKKIYAEVNKENYDLSKLIALCVLYKNKIVSKDEFEKNVRKFLNLGHTVGHALEKLSNYKIAHGIAVIMGLKSITDYAKSIGYITCEEYQKIINLINKNATLPSVNFNSEDILSVIKNDKKRRGDFIDVVLPKKIGKVEIVKISLNDLKGVKYEGIGK